MSNLTLQLRCDGDQEFHLDVNCEIPLTGVTAIYGPSGSGKSTLLDCIAGLRQASTESVIRMDTNVWQEPGLNTAPWERQIGYVFQDARLFPHLTVAQNLDYAVQRRRPVTSPGLEDVIEWMDLHELLWRAPDTLSAGEKQRVAIARALLSAPRLLLLDEPLANLDQSARQHCLRCLHTLSKELALPMIYVSHDIEEVAQLADHLVLIDKGRVVDQGSLLSLCSQLDTRLSQEEQAAAILTATVARQDTTFNLTELDLEGSTLYVNHLPKAVGHACRVRIPARDVSLCRQKPNDSSILNILPVTLCEIQDSDSPRLMLRLSLGTQFLLARITRKSAVELKLQLGDSLYAQIKSAALLMDSADNS